MAVIRHERQVSRRAALQALYAAEVTEQPAWEIVQTSPLPADAEELGTYAKRLIEGVEAHRAEIDAYLDEMSSNWSLERMPIIDYAIMRIAIFEMLYVPEVPVSVAINEAVDLAKEFGGEDESHRFVNGVLGAVAQRLGNQGLTQSDTEMQEVASEEESSFADEDAGIAKD